MYEKEVLYVARRDNHEPALSVASPFYVSIVGRVFCSFFFFCFASCPSSGKETPALVSLLSMKRKQSICNSFLRFGRLGRPTASDSGGEVDHPVDHTFVNIYCQASALDLELLRTLAGQRKVSLTGMARPGSGGSVCFACGWGGSWLAFSFFAQTVLGRLESPPPARFLCFMFCCGCWLAIYCARGCICSLPGI